MRDRITHGVGDIDGTRAGVDCLLDDATEKIDLGASTILTGKLHISTEGTRALDGAHRLLDDLIRVKAQLVLHMDRVGGVEGVYATGIGIEPRTGRTIDL